MGDRVPYLHVCITCRAGRELAEGEVPPGKLFFDRLAAAPCAVDVRPVTCLSLCQQGCAAAITAPGKWGYLLGGLSLAVGDDLLAYGALYAASRTGTVLPSKRPAALADMIRGRLPALELL